MNQVPLPTLNISQETQQRFLCHNSNTTLTTQHPAWAIPAPQGVTFPLILQRFSTQGTTNRIKAWQCSSPLWRFPSPWSSPYLSVLSRAVLLVPRFQWHRGSWRWPGRSWQPSDGCAAGSSPRTRSLKGWLPRKSNFLNSLETALETLEMASQQVCCSPRREDGKAEMHQL